MSVPLIIPQAPVLFEVTLRGNITGMTEEQAIWWLRGKLSTMGLNYTHEIKVRRVTPEELAAMDLGIKPH